MDTLRLFFGISRFGLAEIFNRIYYQMAKFTLDLEDRIRPVLKRIDQVILALESLVLESAVNSQQNKESSEVPDIKIEEGELQVDHRQVSVPSIFQEPFCLRGVVKHMLAYEASQYELRKGVPYPLELYIAWNAVDDVIPADL